MNSQSIQVSSAATSSSHANRGQKQRLVVCLDGTWNVRDSATNVYHLSNLIAEGEVGTGEERWNQKIYYDEGVGTGLLDGVTGGAFGIGLSENVRQAYDWLIEHYNDGDEIYVFGFSRGAFTARSLVGLITRCGLLRRGAPMSPSEMWKSYQILGRHPRARTDSEPSSSWWEFLFHKQERLFRAIWELKRESWERDWETRWAAERKKANQPSHVRQPSPPVNRAERLLVEWSRRVPITCVGVFDTVGSMGLEALAIPGVRDHLTQFHDTHLTTIIQNGFHALAIDENRANFSHIPWHREINSGFPTGVTPLGGRVEQRWFIGAHSNIGGGYYDDVLAQRPLAWFVEECKKLGLVFGKETPDVQTWPDQKDCIPLLESEQGKNDLKLKKQEPNVVDSYTEFGYGIWKHLIRSKRNYRRIVPPKEHQNDKEVQSENESLDPSVINLSDTDKARPLVVANYNPPNVWEYRKRSEKDFNEPKPRHRYLESGASWLWLVGWLVGIAVTGWGIGAWLDHACCDMSDFRWRWLALAMPLIALITDYLESRFNHAVALDPDGAKSFEDLVTVFFCIRFLAIVAFAAGLIMVVCLLVKVLICYCHHLCHKSTG